MQEVNIREANQHFSQYIKAVESGEEIIITRRGRPVAKIVGVKPTRSLSEEQNEARRRALQLMRAGYALGGERIDREAIHER